MSKLLIVFVATMLFPLMVSAQRVTSGQNELTKDQKRGQDLFQQHCSVCHSHFVLTNPKSYGPRLSEDVVAGNEETVKQTILDGRPGLMPGFKYGLTSSQVDSIIKFLKTVSSHVPVQSKP